MKVNKTILKVSVCITTFNEKAETVKKLLSALNNQSLKPDEIIIIDAKDYNNCSRSKGRNLAIKKAKNELIAITDAGCIPHKNWLKNITKPFIKEKVDVVAGGYKMVTKNSFQRAESIFLGTQQTDINDDFMPSARSMAFTKSIWKKSGGFPEELKNTAEDTVFNIKLLKVGAKFSVAKDAVVDWNLPESLLGFSKRVYSYAKGDAESGIWWHPVKKLRTHNLKILTIFARYLAFFLIYSTFDYRILGLVLIVYVLFANSKAKLWGIILQFVSDFACIIGFSHGILQTSIKRT